eukprot:gnl/Dysnectes_brevis/123_a146_5008.p1 GENE.gnl/Dysnectes_brevis/123_a146_5008~~gnl/Dysnectes_brevis/123_a146_5008.p1  ORF type:complete len:604 (+),score=265.90 gnl/Dysnectes_brevis/123_a146_5008:41-1852(+)
MTSVIQDVTLIVQKALDAAFADTIKQLTEADKLSKKVEKSFVAMIMAPSNRNFGDYQINNVMSIFKQLKKALKPSPFPKPTDVAAQLLSHFPENEIIGRIDVKGPFINIFLSDDYIVSKTRSIFLTADELPLPPPVKKMTVLVDFSSPNIAKSMHVGHLRSTIIGDTVCRLFEFLGHKTLRVNHVGDWGTQFGMLITHLEDQCPGFLDTPPDIKDLVAFYQQAKGRFDVDKPFALEAHKAVVRLQAGGERELAAWKMLCAVSRAEFQRIYSLLDVTLEEVGESFYNPMLPSVVEDMTALGRIEESDGALICRVPGIKFPLIVRKSDGGYTYDTTDLAAVRYRAGMDVGRAVYVTDLGQAKHFELVFKASTAADWNLMPNGEHMTMEHVGFGVVCGDDGKKFKSRAGTTVKLQDLLSEAVIRAKAQLVERGRDKELSEEEMELVAHAVGIGAVKYADLCSQRIKDYRFSFEKMLSFKGNTATYMLYSYARIASIARKVGVDSSLLVGPDYAGQLTVSESQERALMVQLMTLPDSILATHKDLMPHRLCEWLYTTAGAFTDFYERCRVIQADGSVNNSRLALCEATRKGLKLVLHLLGLRTVDRM